MVNEYSTLSGGLGLELRRCFSAPKSNKSQGLYFAVFTDSAVWRKGLRERERFTNANIWLLHFGNDRAMPFNRVCAAGHDLPRQSEGDNNEEEKASGDNSADLESADLPLGNALRYL